MCGATKIVIETFETIKYLDGEYGHIPGDRSLRVSNRTAEAVDLLAQLLRDLSEIALGGKPHLDLAGIELAAIEVFDGCECRVRVVVFNEGESFRFSGIFVRQNAHTLHHTYEKIQHNEPLRVIKIHWRVVD